MQAAGGARITFDTPGYARAINDEIESDEAAPTSGSNETTDPFLNCRM